MQTCKHLYMASCQRSVWFYILVDQLMPQGFSLLGFNEKEATNLSAWQLEHLVLRALGLRENWASRSPAHTRVMTIPASYPLPEACARNVSLYFLNGRCLLATTMYDRNSGQRKFITTCWDTSGDEPSAIAAMEYEHLQGITVNNNSSSVFNWALTRSVLSQDG